MQTAIGNGDAGIVVLARHLVRQAIAEADNPALFHQGGALFLTLEVGGCGEQRLEAPFGVETTEGLAERLDLGFVETGLVALFDLGEARIDFGKGDRRVQLVGKAGLEGPDGDLAGKLFVAA